MENANKKTLMFGITALIAVIVLLVYASRVSSGPGKLDGFAQCLKDKGALFYGAFWCSHCQNQKALFGSSKKYLPYIECSTPNAKGQLPICIDNKIASFPTWVFPDMSTTTGEISLAVLSEKTGCALPTEEEPVK
ncbi:MAG: hypothetical protein Q7S86_01765 [bacterium]|nr:hypothetical protein [bacterium]